MDKIIIVRYSEIHLKGNNRGYFENILRSNLSKALTGIECRLIKVSGRYLIEDYQPSEQAKIIEKVKKVFGVYSLSIAEIVETSLENISSKSIELAKQFTAGTFKVVTNRADKKFCLNSLQLSAEIGGRILETCPQLTVDVHNPSQQLFIDIRENGKTFVYNSNIYAVNGMPYGTGGKGILLLSGGIDSPVAGYMMAKRGMTVRALHFHSFPYTSLKAKEKVIELGKILKEYTQELTIDMISFTEIQTQIHEKCPSQFMITIMRRFMMRIAELVAKQRNCGAIISGESLGQVASQTLQSINCTNIVVNIPVFRPLIGFDKNEIIDYAYKIGSFETSIQPYEDCCTVFLPDNPATHPNMRDVKLAEEALDVDTLIANAMSTLETITI